MKTPFSEGGLPFYCGGSYPAGEYYADCYKYEYTLDEWSMSGTMTEAKAYGAYDSSQFWGLILAGGTNDVADVKLRRTAWWHVRRAGWRDRSSWRLSERNISMSEVTTEKQGSSRLDTRGYVWSSTSEHLPFNMRFVIRASLSRETQLPTLLWTATVNTGGLMWI